jgi:hypothetical protein
VKGSGKKAKGKAKGKGRGKAGKKGRKKGKKGKTKSAPQTVTFLPKEVVLPTPEEAGERPGEAGPEEARGKPGEEGGRPRKRREKAGEKGGEREGKEGKGPGEEPEEEPEEEEEESGEEAEKGGALGYAPETGKEEEPKGAPREEWVELKIHRGAGVGSMNLLGIWNALYRSGEVFDFVVGSYSSEGTAAVRYFVGSSPEVINHLKVVAKSLGIWALDCSPPELGGGLDLQMADYFGYLIAPPERSPRPEDEEARVVRYSEELLSALSQGGAVWVRGRAEPRAATVIRRRGAAPPGDGWIKDLGRGMSGVLPSIDGKRGEEIRRREIEQKRQALEERKAFASLRASEPLMVVGMRILGTPEEVSRIAATLPAPTKPVESSLQEYGSSSDPLPIPALGGWKSTLRKPALLLSFLLPFLLLSGAMKAFPFALRVPGIVGMAIWILLPFLCTLWVWAKWRVWKPIVCSTRELATLFSFPVHFERFPLEFAETPPEEIVAPEVVR